jgi:NADH-quinone oxidoreductase subunit L
MMALCGVPFFFSGFWSKDEILHVTHQWPVSPVPFFMAAAAAFLTAFYMTRQMCYVFAGSYRGHAHPHESPAVMTVPLSILAGVAILLSIPATPAWPWFHSYQTGHPTTLDFSRLFDHGFLTIAGLSILIVTAGIGIGYLLYRRITDTDPLERVCHIGYQALANRLYVDELYNATVVRALTGFGLLATGIERWIFSGLVRLVGGFSLLASALSDLFDRFWINLGFDSLCGGLSDGGQFFSSWENGRVQSYLRFLSLGAVVLLVIIGWFLT